jgi:sucrose-6-phosphate hydrolase SacC (GH32 family)
MKTFKTTLLVLLALVFFNSCSDDDGTTDGPLPPPSISLTITLETPQDQIGDFACNAMALHDGKVWSVGGATYSSGIYNSDVWKSTDGKAWVSVLENIVGDRCGHTLTKFNGKLWLIGGENNAGVWYEDIWSSTDGSTWVNIFLTAPFGKVAFHDTVVFNGKMYVIAADADTGNMKVYSSPDGEIWTPETLNAFPARVSHKTVVFNGAMYVIGGENVAGSKLNEIWTSSNGVNWSLITNNASVFPGINGHTATVYNNKVWIIGGRTNASVYTNDIYYSGNLQDWTKYSELNPIVPIVAHSALLYNDAIWIFGGYVGSDTTTGKIWSIKED